MASGTGLAAAFTVALPAVAGAAPAALPSNCTQSGAVVTCTFGYTGAEQTFTVPPGTTSVKVTAIGAAGGADGSSRGNGDSGGEGAQVTGTLTGLAGDQTLYVEVGQAPNTSATGFGTQPTAFNGGGAPGYGNLAGGGGGATDVRTVSRTATGTLASRLIVAGGGGGHAETSNAEEAGGNAGQNGSPATGSAGFGQGGFAGTQTAGGAGGAGAGDYSSANGTAGSLGQGGSGHIGSPSAGGGGGGYYGGGGGGGGAGQDHPDAAGGGGGGSSLVPSGGTQTLTSAAAAVTITYTATPQLSIASHANIIVNATSPAGAVVTYTAPAVTDQANPTSPPAAVCKPASGSTFKIGTTTVTCTATDPADGNSPVSTTFTVTVVGAAGQLAALYTAVHGYGGGGPAELVRIAEHEVATGNTAMACLALQAFTIDVATYFPPIPPAKASAFISAATQIQNVLGC